MLLVPKDVSEDEMDCCADVVDSNWVCECLCFFDLDFEGDFRCSSASVCSEEDLFNGDSEMEEMSMMFS